MHRAVTIALVTLATFISAACFEDDVKPRRGPFAFHYGASLDEKALRWYSQFDLLVTHDPLPRAQVDLLHAAGTKLLLYEWSVAFYDTRATTWDRTLLGTNGVLNSKPLTGGAGAADAGAWYYDPASPDHATQRAATLAKHLNAAGYDGVFLDTTRFESVHPEARDEYVRRHPGLTYDEAFSRFLIAFRKQMPGGVIFTNQGYRSAEHLLPYVDWDLTESLITRPREGGGYELRPWNDEGDAWNSIHFIFQRMIAPFEARYPAVRFGHLNYISKTEPATVRLISAVAHLFDGEGYAASDDPAHEVDPVYFTDLGAAVSDRIESDGGSAVHRFFERGLVVVTASPDPIVIPVRRRGLRNRFTEEVHCGETIRIAPSAGVPRAEFFDRTSACR